MLPRINSEDDISSDSRSDATDTSILLSSIVGNVPKETLTVISGTDEGRVFPLDSDEVWIGRAEDCSVILTDKGVSRRHAVVSRKGELIVVRDNDAKNGTFVNNRRIVEPYALQTGDEIQVGPSACLLFSHEDKIGMPRSARERVLAEKLQTEKVDSLASMVAGVAHEINTPLGVANTANAMIAALAEEVRRAPTSEKVQELLADLKASTGLVSKNLERASQLVRTFKMLSSRESYDEHVSCDLGALVRDAVETLTVEMASKRLTIATTFVGDRFPWVGFQGGMVRVLGHLIQNSLIHAYEGEEAGRVDIRLEMKRKTYRLEFEDYGAGIPLAIVPRIFEPFVTSGREKRGTGLGLAIVHNIVTNVLGGAITFTSQRGKGTLFVISIPVVVPVDPKG